MKSGNFFTTIPLRPQIKDLIECNHIASNLISKSQNARIDGTSNDVCNGKKVNDLMDNEDIFDQDFTITINIDGAAVFKSSNFSVWPVQCMVNELSHEDRKRNVLIVGFWCGPSKPDMTTFLKPFVDEVLLLGDEGFQWRNPLNGRIVTSKVFCSCCTCDSVARPIIQNCTQFNGKYGCSWCYHAGERVEKGNGHVRCYPFREPEPDLRTALTHEEDVIQAVELGQSVHGIKGPSIILFMPKFDVICGFVVDYMHCVLLGVVKHLTGLWFDSNNHRQPWYIGLRKAEVNQRLISVSPPHEVSRVPRKLDTRKHWKASEWRSFLLFYSLFVLQGILPSRYLNHLFLLVHAIYRLLQNEVSRVDIDCSELALKKFVIKMEELYGKENVSYNVHQLCHLPTSVCDWGPAWCHSNFPFEGNNHVLLNLVHGSQCIPQQMAHRYVLYRLSKKLATECMQETDQECRNLFGKFSHVGGYRPVKKKRIGNFELLGKSTQKQLDNDDHIAVEFLLGEPLRNFQAEYHSRFQLRGRLFQTERYQRVGRKRDDSVIQLMDGSFCSVKAVVVLKLDCLCVNDCMCNRTPLIILTEINEYQYVDRQLGIRSSHIHRVQRDGQPPRAVYEHDFREKCVVCKTEGNTKFLVVLPNRWERD